MVHGGFDWNLDPWPRLFSMNYVVATCFELEYRYIDSPFKFVRGFLVELIFKV